MLRVGSANMNNRSLGLDSECDVVIDARAAGEEHRRKTMTEIRLDLLGEHLGVAPQVVAQAQARCGSLIGAIEELRGKGRALRPYTPEEVGPLEALAGDAEPLDPDGPLAENEPLTSISGWRRLFGDRLSKA